MGLSLRLSQPWQAKWLPVAVGTSIVAITLGLWQSLKIQEQTRIHRQIDFATISIGREVYSQANNRVQALVRMSQQWAAQGRPSQQNWTIDAESLLYDYPGYHAFEWIDPTLERRWIVSIADDEAIQDLNVAAEFRRKDALESAKQNRTVSLSPTVALNQNETQMLVYAPIFLTLDQSFDGFILGVFRVQHLLDTILNQQVAPDYGITIREQGTEIYRRGPVGTTANNLKTRWSQHTEINLHNMVWELEVWPTPALLAQEQSPLPAVVLISGLLMAGLSTWVVWLTQTWQQQSSQLMTETSERQRAEQDLERFFNLSVDLLCIAGTDGYFKRINPAFETTLGHSTEILLSQPFLDFVHPDDQAATLAEIETLATGQPTLNFENRYRCHDGTYRWLSWAAFHIAQSGLLYAIARDISDRKATEENLRQFSANLKHLHRINTTHYENFDHLFTDCLETGCQILGLETGIISQITGQTYTIRSVHSTLTSLAADQSFALANTYCAAVVQKHQTVTYKHVGSLATMKGHPVYQSLHLESYLGTPIWVNGEIYGTLNFSSTQIRDQNFSCHEQEIIELMAQSLGRFLAADLAQQQQQSVEAALRESEARFRTVANSAPVLLWMTDANKRYTFLNQTWLTFTGRSLEHERGNGWDEGIHPDDRDRCLATYANAFDTRRMFEMEYRLRRHDGQYRWLLTRGIPRFSPDGSFAGYIGTCIDISDRHDVEKLKDEFISVVNHELRTPLTSILGSLDLLASGVLNSKPEKGQRMLQIAANNADRLVRLINDMLDIERIESGKMTLNKQVCDGAELMSTAVDEIRSLATQADIQLSVTPLPVRVWADPDRILQVFTNLLSNAIKFSSPGDTVELTATIEAGQATADSTNERLAVSTQQVRFQVKDQGRGIPADKLKTIFDRFQQVDASDSRKRGGTGLGLAVCRSIVHHHGGSIWVKSILDQGSTFFFSLPVLPSPTPLPACKQEQPLVLVCDDDPSVQTVIATMLEHQQYRVMTVSSGQAAVAQAAAQRPQVILLNLLMPGMSGWETLAALKARSQTRNIPVIILSGLSPEEGAHLSAEISDWIVKPPDEAILFRALQQALAPLPQDIRVLIVEDDLDLAQVLIAMFERHGITPHHAATGQAGIHLSQQVMPDLLVLDLALPESNGFAVVDWLRQHNQLCRVPLVIYTAKDLDDAERQQLRLGQTLFLTKGRVSPDEFEKQVMGLIERVTSL
ncbi:pas domain s-box [Leptolyngbya sp. Heron Island J]|uniref:PAS domain S-box protein n=1 Tax=Leptolyngbya sp. Heron Island J TaxID=1385935 RepID=UPI0003B9811F|nr:PAS domain S-box protein [Leptolyngbya sp. Heron Island J]ESA35723.1 pas domain s-box [Leptolyngbya sp. Heron Island J]